MNCKKEWTRGFMIDSISSKFVLNEYKKHREDVLMDREKAMLPATQILAEAELKKREKMVDVKKLQQDFSTKLENLKKDNMEMVKLHESLDILIKKYRKHIPVGYRNWNDMLVLLGNHAKNRPCMACYHGSLHNMVCNDCKRAHCVKCMNPLWEEKHVCHPIALKAEIQIQEIFAEFKKLNMDKDTTRNCMVFARELMLLQEQQRKELSKARFKVQTEMEREMAMPMPMDPNQPSTSKPTKERKVSFIRACPAEGCRGFLSTQWKCGMCNLKACSKCHEVKDENHVCKKEDLETAALLAKEARNCPSCAATICKVSGCDQMWCTQCQTAFSWTTGEIVHSGTIHNPHYYEWMRKNGNLQREVGDIPCGGIPHFIVIERAMREKRASFVGWETYHQLTGEMMQLRTWYINRNYTDNTDIRVKYLLKEYDDVKFKRMLQMRAKAIEKVRSIDEVLDMFVMVMTTLLQRLIVVSAQEITDVKTEMDGLCEYFNESMKRVGEIYQCKTPTISKQKRLIRVGEKKTT
jgi:hypothetical protein